MSTKVKFYTFGCKVNQYNSALIDTNLSEAGIIIDESSPDYVIVNMCSLTSNAVRKVRLTINRIKREYSDAQIILTGCIPDELDIDVDYKVHARDKDDIYKIFSLSINALEYVSKFPSHTRAFVKIQEGCENFCTYCIVPFMRDQMYSKPLDVFRQEIELLGNKGYKEIVLTGTHINRYKVKDGDIKDVMNILEKNPNIERFRISSIEPNEIDEIFIKILKDSKKFCPHLHLSIQSASDNVLKGMGRHYSVKKVIEIIKEFKSIENFEYSSDFIVGFPGETQKEFEETCDFVKKYPPVFLHVFPFSKRPGTKAWGMKEFLNGKEKKERADLLRKIEKSVKINVNKNYVNKNLKTLVETDDNEYYSGYSENYIKVYVKKGDINYKNNIICVKIKKIFRDGVLGEVI